MTPTLHDVPHEVLEFQRLFFPHHAGKQKALLARDGKLVHYTSAEVASRIIAGRSVWMRNAMTMNDFSEVQHGLSCLSKAWASADGEVFKSALERYQSGIVSEIEERFNPWQIDMRASTYLTCLSEHLSAEDENGRLSMWRAYGGQSGVALILNLNPFVAITDKLAAMSSAVAYETPEGFGNRMRSIGVSIASAEAYVSQMSRDDLRETVFTMLRFAALCTKHPGFSEELEWRIIYSPNLQASAAISKHVEVVRGLPQVVHKIPLINDPDKGLVGAAIPDLLHKIIIGPTADQFAVAQALEQLLADAGVEHPDKLIHISGIPLRHY